MAFKIEIFIQKLNGDYKYVKTLTKLYDTFEEAEKACIQKNKDLGVPEDGIVPPGHKFCMFDNC